MVRPERRGIFRPTGVEGPDRLAAGNVERLDRARGHVDRGIVIDRATHHDEAARDQRGRGELEPAGLEPGPVTARLTAPPWPKPAHSRPVCASSAIRRASAVAMMMRCGHEPSALRVAPGQAAS
jgi:hypothetical protein